MDNKTYFDRAKVVWQMEARSIEKLTKTIDSVSFNNVIEEIRACLKRKCRIYITGKGTSGAAGEKIAHTLCCVDIPASFLSTGIGVGASMGLLQKGDILIIISKGGNTEEVVKMIKPCTNKGVKVIGVTSNPASQLGLKSDIMLKVSVEREVDVKNSLATASTIAMVATFDAIAVAMQEMG